MYAGEKLLHVNFMIDYNKQEYTYMYMYKALLYYLGISGEGGGDRGKVITVPF